MAAWLSHAQAEGRFEFKSPTNLFLDYSYVGFSPSEIKINGNPDSPVGLLFEAQIAPNLFFPQLHFGAVNRPSGETVLSLVLTPRIRLRMLNEDSSPVIPPSFMPKLTLQLLHLRALDGREDARRGLLMGAHLIAGHHSNGQSGCFFANQTGSDPHCTPEGQLPLNEVSGSFSTNYLRGELHGRYIFNADEAFQSGWVVGLSAAVETNLSGGAGGISADQREVYGDGLYEIQGTLQRLWSGNRARATIGASYPYGETPSRGPTVSVEAALMPEWAGGFGLFARHVSGRDYYNILFLERVNLWLIGVIFELGPGVNIPLPDQKGVLTN
ncbi:MAG: hypothetical protein EPO39_00405 [Candidatus Manganitrophaceae bacterium]|nr:MAG: hypothetical protein EPO39_00405 [Candidatus Manganitrophaceae bacterium]